MYSWKLGHLSFRRIGLGIVFAGLTACSGGSSDTHSDDNTVKPPGDVGVPDVPANGTVTINESAISGTIQNNQLHFSIPVTTVGNENATGSLVVAITEVDGDPIVSTTRVNYSVAKGATTVVQGSLKLPDGLSDQAALSKYNLVVDEAMMGRLHLTKSLFYVVPAYEIVLEGPASTLREKNAAYRVRAVSSVGKQPMADVPVKLLVVSDDGKVEEWTQNTSAMGDALFDVSLEDPGEYEVVAEGSAYGTTAVVSGMLKVEISPNKLLLTTDKPIYQPGHTMHLRALALEKPALGPVAEQTILFEIEDGKGNKIYKEERTTDEWGIAHTEFPIANIVNLGTFKVRAILGETIAEKTAEVSLYALPKFGIKVSIEEPWYMPGMTVAGVVDARYFFGKAVASGSVTIKASTIDVEETVFEEITGQTDAEGRFNFAIKLPNFFAGLPLEQGNAVVQLEIAVTDSAEQEVKKSVGVVVANKPIRIVAVPESGVLVPETTNHLHVFVTDPLGSPYDMAQVLAQASWLESDLESTTDEYGYADLALAVPNLDTTPSLTLTVTPKVGASVTETLSFTLQPGKNFVLVRTDKAVYETGETVLVEIRTSSPTGHIYVDWLNGGQVVDMRTLTAEDGVATFSMDVDASLMGDNRVEAYIVDLDGNVVRAGRSLFARSGKDLVVKLETDKVTYGPGDPAKLTFSVVDENGDPAPSALGVQIVDEAVFALIEAKPGLLKTYFEIEAAFAQPKYEIHGANWNVTDLVFNDTNSEDPNEASAAQTKAEAAFAAMEDSGMTGIYAASWAKTLQQIQSELAPFYTDKQQKLVDLYKAAMPQIKADLLELGCQETNWCQSLGKEYFAAVIEKLGEEVKAYDFWGGGFETSSLDWSRMRVRSNGPDEVGGNTDDWSFTVDAEDLGLSLYQEWNEGGNGGWADAAAGGWDDDNIQEPPTEPDGKGNEPAGPKVRDDFPETLYNNPALITDGQGKAVVDLEMADSITEWRVTSLAHTKNGRLGSGLAGITVFQDFFIDINFPAKLTRNDEISFPIAVYNYLAEPQTVTVELMSDNWFTPLGDTTLTLNLTPGEVAVAKFPVRVDKVGLHSLLVKGTGTELSDAVSRMVRVVPDGKAFPLAQSGALAQGEVKHEVTFPENSIDGSNVLYINLYPAFLSQVVEGLDSMFAVPYGCFEQASSTTWPNVLILSYMNETGQITPEIQMKAESLITAGYQLLLTYEHNGGGFSWFGEPGDPYLTVTALGLMEFADMAEVYPIDATLIPRTRTWLLSKQEADGSWKGDISEFYSFQTGTLRNTAYVIWSLATTGYAGPELDKAITYVKGELAEDTDPYTLATVANAMVMAAPDDPKTDEVLQKLDALKVVEGDLIHWGSDNTQTSFYGYGDSAAVETTAIVTHAMLLRGGYKATVDGAIQWLLTKKDTNGNFGSSQASVLTLRTLIAAAKLGTEGATGTVEIAIDDVTAHSVVLSADQWDVLKTIDLVNYATTGQHKVGLKFVGEGRVSYNLVSSHNIPWTETPAEPPGPAKITLTYDKTQIQVNETVTATLTVENTTTANLNMVLVTVGIAPGFEVLTEDLTPHIESGVLAKFETTGKQLTLYIEVMEPNETLSFVYRLQATMPVKASDNGAVSYLYYEPQTTRMELPSQTMEAVE
ncbi:MAG: alpha-2-macroglobulin [Myxococcales bacterium]|nr:alpha-2-macroglobulin [Myxococcales bacterium]